MTVYEESSGEPVTKPTAYEEWLSYCASVDASAGERFLGLCALAAADKFIAEIAKITGTLPGPKTT